ncbi:MAG: glycoside hydrolase family 88 protein [Lentisphaeria bacterium]|nr:glycoside hydrolase family 88 protein [Lentisphaeria bacterium]
MNNALWIILIVYFLVTVPVLGFDLYHWLIDRYCRFHIGRWKDDNTWFERVFNVAAGWLPNPPTVQTSNHTRLLLLDKMTGKSGLGRVQSWQTAGLILGVREFSERLPDCFHEQCAHFFINGDGMWKKPPAHIDNAMLAYALLKVTEQPETIQPAMDYIAELIEQRIGADGLVAYSNVRSNLRYVDTLGLICPFLALYGKIYAKPGCVDLACKQIMDFNHHGLLGDTFLPNHAFDAKTKLPIGVYGWGRGTGWYAIALLDTYQELPSSRTKQTLKDTIRSAAEGYKGYQRNDGGFGIIIQDLNSAYDSSATAVIAYFYSVCHEIFGHEDYLDISRACVKKLKSVTRLTGKIDYCQGDTKDVGIFSQLSGPMPFAQGFALRAYAKCLKADL